MKKEKSGLNLRFTEAELKNGRLRRDLKKLVEQKLLLQKTEYFEVSPVELELISDLYSFVPLKADGYGKKKYANEIGKFNGKRCVLVK